MTRDGVIKIMSVLRGAYPQFYRDISKAEALDTINLWTDMFSGDDESLVAAAVKCLIETDEKGFPPTIGQVKAKMRMLTSGKELSDAEAWKLISDAARNGIYGSAEEFAKLPPILQRIVGSPAQLKEWAMMDSQTLHSVVASNVQRSYKAISSKEREVAALPADVKAMLGNVVKPIEPPTLPRYEPKEKALQRLEAERRAGWEAARREGTAKKRSREEIIAKLRGES